MSDEPKDPSSPPVRPGTTEESTSALTQNTAIPSAAGQNPLMPTHHVHAERSSFEFSMGDGMLPSPRTIAEYYQLSPELALRAFALAEKEQAHRHRMDQQSINTHTTIAKRGQAFALIIVLAGFGLAGGLAFAGCPGLAGVVVALDILGVVSAFLAPKFLRKGQLPDDTDEEGFTPPPPVRISSENRRMSAQTGPTQSGTPPPAKG